MNAEDAQRLANLTLKQSRELGEFARMVGQVEPEELREELKVALGLSIYDLSELAKRLKAAFPDIDTPWAEPTP